MKICLYFQPKEKSNNFEGVRLRKNIRGALEANNIPYAKNIIDTYDIIHFISLNDEKKINDIKELGIPVVFSALSCESDEAAKILDNGSDKYSLSQKAKRVLNKVDLIIVNDNASKEVLLKNGITTKIEVLSVGVNLSRFDPQPNEENLFYSYYQLEREQKFIVAVGEYSKDKLLTLYEIAKKCPDYRFFFFADEKLTRFARLHHKTPNNLRLCPLTNNEIYCSMMKKASIYLAFDNENHSPITLLDAAASKTQIVALEPTELNTDLLNDLGAYIAKDIDSAGETINKLMSGELELTTDKAYEFAQNNSLKHVGEKLNEIYLNLLDGRK